MAEAELKAFIESTTKTQDSLFKKYDEATFDAWESDTTTKDFVIIRPSGNPMKMAMVRHKRNTLVPKPRTPIVAAIVLSTRLSHRIIPSALRSSLAARSSRA